MACLDILTCPVWTGYSGIVLPELLVVVVQSSTLGIDLYPESKPVVVVSRLQRSSSPYRPLSLLVMPQLPNKTDRRMDSS